MSNEAKGEAVKKMLDAPICFEGRVFLEDEDGNTAEASVLFGYGKVPSPKDIADVVKGAIDSANESTGKEWHLPTPRNFMAIAAQDVCGKRVSIVGPMEDGYVMLQGGAR